MEKVAEWKQDVDNLSLIDDNLLSTCQKQMKCESSGNITPSNIKIEISSDDFIHSFEEIIIHSHSGINEFHIVLILF